MSTRADRIFEIIDLGGGRLKVNEIHHKLSRMEGIPSDDLSPTTVSSTVRQDNRGRSSVGKLKRFNVFGDGDEERGYISIIKQVSPETSKTKILSEYSLQIPLLIEEANEKAGKELKRAIQKMPWQEFESNFLLQVLEALGFSQVEITQRTRDGGKDAICSGRM